VPHWPHTSLPRSLNLQAELGGLMLKRVLLLVLLLDRAATHLAGPLRTPLLFRLGGSVKSSKQVG
jgi:hypothetical protein